MTPASSSASTRSLAGRASTPRVLRPGSRRPLVAPRQSASGATAPPVHLLPGLLPRGVLWVGPPPFASVAKAARFLRPPPLGARSVAPRASSSAVTTMHRGSSFASVRSSAGRPSPPRPRRRASCRRRAARRPSALQGTLWRRGRRARLQLRRRGAPSEAQRPSSSAMMTPGRSSASVRRSAGLPLRPQTLRRASRKHQAVRRRSAGAMKLS
mmetsp:Transcript_70822/g.195640  ORF Transcript_70822/g.195640 Transcript_70822/m.195640 type:complete len:212 (-) Transcript_70822:1584-2219(-)